MQKDTLYAWILLIVIVGGLALIYQSSAKNKDIFAEFDTNRYNHK